MSTTSESTYEQQLNGSFSGVLRWPEFDALWRQLRDNDSQHWYIYAVDDDLPQQPAAAAEFCQRLDELEQWLKHQHQEDYCGIVYVDSKTHPSFVKIYDPNNLGVVCGISREPIAPAWTLSKSKPSFNRDKQQVKTVWWKKWLRFRR